MKKDRSQANAMNHAIGTQSLAVEDDVFVALIHESR
jgi:hypothetical protein